MKLYRPDMMVTYRKFGRTCNCLPCWISSLALSIAVGVLFFGNVSVVIAEPLRFSAGISWSESVSNLAGNLSPEIVTDGRQILFSTPFSQGNYSSPLLSVKTGMNGGSGCRTYSQKSKGKEILCVTAERIGANSYNVVYKLKTELASEGRPGTFIQREAAFTLSYNASSCSISVSSAGRNYFDNLSRLYPAVQILNQACRIT